MADLIFRMLSTSESASLLEQMAAKCVALAADCERSEAKRFLRMLAVDLIMEADRQRSLMKPPATLR